MRQNKLLTFLLGTVLILGCQTTPSKKINQESKKAGTPQEAQSAVKSVVNTFKEKQVNAKYCPLCGRHYSSKLDVCPKDGTALKEVQE